MAIFWKKGQKDNLSEHFNMDEFSCHCSFPECIDQMIEEELINRLESIRTEIGMPITIDSGFRCAQYQQYLKATNASTVVATKSQHELGAACDMKAPIAYDDLLKVCEKYFSSIGLGKTFLHTDLRSDYHRWDY